MVMPIVILVSAALLVIGVRMLERVKASAALNRACALEVVDPVFPAEKILRLKWMGINVIEDVAD